MSRARCADNRNGGYGSRLFRRNTPNTRPGYNRSMRLQASKTFVVERTLPPALEALRTLSMNYAWSWTTGSATLFEQLDPSLWQAVHHNPVRLLQGVAEGALERAAGDPAYVRAVENRAAELAEYLARPRLLEGGVLEPREVIAYFSFEFAISESLPAYSGGLGVLAGDHLKSSSDLALPLVGVGLFYRQGYFHQELNAEGWQQEAYEDIDPAHHGLEPVLDASGGQLLVRVPFPGRDIACAVLKMQVGQVPLYLLDSDTPENSEEDRAIAARLYGGDIETRIQQEMLLGIGGIRMLKALGLHPAVCHMNEGHSSLLALERVREIVAETGAPFAEARLAVTAGTAFTTHTPVAAGIDLFPAELLRRYLGPYREWLGLDDRGLLGLGRINPDDDSEPFSMALLGLRLSGFKNGVSKLHQDVSRKLWASAWPALPVGQAPIHAVTNGVHLPTWVSHDVAELFDRYLGHQWRQDPLGGTDWSRIAAIPDEELWAIRTQQRHRLVDRARTQHRESSARISQPTSAGALNPEALTIGFARRFAAYKRATLLFRDIERLAAIVNNTDRPVQFLFAGKAHPRDEAAKQLIKEVVAHSRHPELRGRLIVLERYDVDLARALVQGCDVWLNTPLRPLEASGTSGMKAVANGALHMSVMDGWWAEAYKPGLGWALGRNQVEDSPDIQDAFDSESLYRLLEEEVVPLFYLRRDGAVPHGWIERVKGSIAEYAPAYSTHRMVSEYAARAYAPGVRGWRGFRAENGQRAAELAAWFERIRGGWHSLKLLSVEDEAPAVMRSGSEFHVVVQGHWGELSHHDVRVDVLSGGANSRGALAPQRVSPLRLESIGDDGICRYRGAVAAAASGRQGYSIRVTPDHPALAEPADSGLALWA